MKKIKILIIDDEEDLCMFVKNNLEETGRFNVLTQTEGSKGLETAIGFKPQLIILDFRMPDMHGSEVAFQLRKHKKTKNIPIIFLTALTSKEDLINHGDEELCRFVLAKPANSEEIIKAIDNNLYEKTNLDFLSRLFDKNKKIRWE